MMDKVQKSSDSEHYISPTEPFRIYFMDAIDKQESWVNYMKQEPVTPLRFNLCASL
jgi:hypothetical protein